MVSRPPARLRAGARAVHAAVLEILERRQLFAVDFTLQILHGSDFEAGLPAIDDAPRFAAIVDALEETFPNTIRVSSGDNYLPGPFFNASGDPALAPVLGSASIGRGDVEILNRIGIQASTIGNHEFDAGPREFRNIFAPSGAWQGAQFPYLSSNLNFATEPDLSSASLNAAPGQEASSVKGKLAKSTVITVNGEKIGIVGVTTPLLESISSPGGVGVFPANDNDMATLAATYIQPEIDALRTGQGIDKIVVMAHMQQIALETQLVPLLSGVDIMIAGGSHTLLSDGDDTLRAGDVSAGDYPTLLTNKDGEPTALVNNSANYRYVNRLVARFDANGVLTDFDDNAGTSFFNSAENGAYAADDAGVTAVYNSFSPGHGPFDAGTKGAAVKQVTDAIASVINAKDSILFGQTNVGLDGRRIAVRTQETNLGSLTADANLAEARDTDPTVVVSFKNGGGIRDSIASIDPPTGNLLPPAANPAAGKSAGDISQLDIENSLRFNNQLTTLSVNAAQMKIILEHAVAGTAPGATPGQFPQIGGLQFSFDPSATAQVLAPNLATGIASVTTPGTRVRSAVLVDANGNVVDVLVKDGALVGDPVRQIRIVTLNFLADDPNADGLGGDNYPFASFLTNRVDLGVGEQAALGEYLQETFPVGGAAAFDLAETGPADDLRIQNLSARSDTVLPPTVSVADTSVVEGNPGPVKKKMVFTVSLSAASSRPVTVSYATADGISTANSDYLVKSGSVTFAPGETVKTVEVTVNGDFATEPTDFFYLNLSNPINATIADGQARGTIVDDDASQIRVEDKRIREGNNGTRLVAFTIRLDRPSVLPISVQYTTQNGTAIAGSDYFAKSGTINFKAGQQFANVVITLKSDRLREANETLRLSLFNPKNAILQDPIGVLTIENDD